MKEDYPFLYDGYGLADYIVRSLNDLNKSDWHGDLIDFLGCSDNEELLSIISKWDKTCILHNIINGALYTYTEWYAYKISPEEFVEENIAFITKNKIQSGLKIYNLDYDENHDDELSQLYDDLIEKVKKLSLIHVLFYFFRIGIFYSNFSYRYQELLNNYQKMIILII